MSTKYRVKLTDLYEYRLPLIAQQVRRIRGSYAGFIITMRCEDFLRLTTTSDDQIETIKQRPFPYTKDEYEEVMTHTTNFGRYDLPFLNVSFPSGKVKGHEGRHRTAYVMSRGGDRVPVVIYPKEEDSFTPEVIYYDEEGHRTERRIDGHYTKREDAEKAAQKYADSLSDDCSVMKVRAGYQWGGTLRGAPDRSSREDWQHSAWRVEDFPKQLIGQERESVIVTDFKVGLVKGYHHHREPGES